MVLEVFLYLAVTFGIIITAMTFFEKDMYIDDRYIVEKTEDMNISLTLEMNGVNKKDRKDIEYILKKGRYDNIYDIVTEFRVLGNENETDTCSSTNNNKKKK